MPEEERERLRSQLEDDEAVPRRKKLPRGANAEGCVPLLVRAATPAVGGVKALAEPWQMGWKPLLLAHGPPPCHRVAALCHDLCLLCLTNRA